MRTADFDYHLPEALIAQTPLANRDHSRLMVVDKETGELARRHFFELPDLLEPGDCLVLNNTRVLPARLLGARRHTGGRVELLLLKRLDLNRWETLVKPGKKARIGDVIEFGGGLLTATVTEMAEEGARIVVFQYEGAFEAVLEQLGEMPLPPYITEKLADRERYQTVYSKHQGSAAAPTAGLHFTEALLDKLREKGIRIAFLTLHVGLGTFRPVKAETIEEHTMHAEYYEIDETCCRIVNETRREGGKVIAVGTTCCRTLETAAQADGTLEPASGWTQIFIYPGYSFKVVDRLITNFHLPQSTLLMLVSALAGKENILNAYETAVREGYRFFSFGDGMFLK